MGTPAVKIFTLLGQIYARGSANKQGALELLFQRADDVAQALLRDVEPFGRVRQIHVFANFTKIDKKKEYLYNMMKKIRGNRG